MGLTLTKAPRGSEGKGEDHMTTAPSSAKGWHVFIYRTPEAMMTPTDPPRGPEQLLDFFWNWPALYKCYFEGTREGKPVYDCYIRHRTSRQRRTMVRHFGEGNVHAMRRRLYHAHRVHGRGLSLSLPPPRAWGCRTPPAANA